MQIKKSLIVAATAALATAENVNLVVKSDHSDINGNTLGFPHEGAGLNYAFLGTSSASQLLEYDESSKTFTEPGSTIPQSLGLSGNFIALTVAEPSAEFTFDGNTLQLNGTSDSFYACKNVNDPYNYSQSSYALMYFKDSAPEDCLALTLEKGSTSSSSSAPAPTSSDSTSSSDSLSPSSVFEDVAGIIAPGSTLALIAAVAAALF